MLTDLVETESSGLTLGVATGRAKGGEVIVSVCDHDISKRSRAPSIGCGHECMECERRGLIASGEAVDEGAYACVQRWVGISHEGDAAGVEVE
jgi:hypothetical protein